MKWLQSTDTDFESRLATLLSDRSAVETSVSTPVRDIIATIREQGDTALCDYTARFDRLSLAPEGLAITADEIAREADKVDADLMEALNLAASRIESFHRAQMPSNLAYQDEAGLTLGMRWTPLDAVGLYVPGGKAAYPSSVLMNALPARVAGVGRIAMCVPCPDGVLNPLVLAAARVCGVSEIYRVGGAQAVAALAYGTNSIRPVDRIVGPGNAYVAEAKRQVFGHVGIDSIAGPSEVVIVADNRNNPRFVALDLLAQAEHDELAQAVLITDDAGFARSVVEAVETELKTLPRAAIAGKSWTDHGAVVIVRDWNEAAEIANRFASEHLEVMLDDAEQFSTLIRHAGAMFLGRNCPEAVGDYVGGPNHVLPTSRTARFASGLSVFDFLKRTTTISAGADGLRAVGPAGVRLAKAEGLDAHALSLSARLDALG
ncbi:histidinol dehydrogenase [Asaia bogorensis]|uniref:Histidinol dehydrogenase n=1 Tax=Asaia bogorensis NBRC 16594 TaxID=1231624 RepID=A0AAN4U3N9_9PROT|nr:histidinol dehydrogenase [Asaia bogorensis]BAT20932.1 histidinol dehydrogenase [Asaia bogorensis NBRC 16594]GBQ76709.1 histidinol dehydrogenase [Asaia bogorensis NBRC 16594]GEL54671.1 histidinol dehydrogenase [Asaia bogorensis NBRC 16594]